MNVDTFELVKTVNNAITARRDHQAAWKRFNNLSPAQRDSFLEAFRFMDTKDDIAMHWDRFNHAMEDGHEYFNLDELDAIEAVIGSSW